MLYLIGGPPRMGKSTMAHKMLENNSIPYVSTDGLTVMLKPIGQPSFYDVQKSNLFFPYFDLFISRIIKSCPDYLIEGDAFSPVHVAQLQKKYELRCVFLTMNHATVENIVNHASFDKWTNEVTREHLDGLVQRIQSASADIQSECKSHTIKCFDLSENYSDVFEQAYLSLQSD